MISVCNSQNKVNENSLVKHKNKYFKKNDYVPFDGIVFDVSKKTRNMILQFRMLNGLKNGPYEEWYASGNQKLQVGILMMILLILGLSGMKVDKSNLKKI